MDIGHTSRHKYSTPSNILHTDINIEVDSSRWALFKHWKLYKETNLDIMYATKYGLFHKLIIFTSLTWVKDTCLNLFINETY